MTATSPRYRRHWLCRLGFHKWDNGEEHEKHRLTIFRCARCECTYINFWDNEGKLKP